MLWGKVKIDVVGAPRCECDECSCEDESDEYETSEGPYRGTVEVPKPVSGSYSLAREMYKIAVASKEAERKVREAELAAKILNTKEVLLPAVFAEILARAKLGVTYAVIRSLVPRDMLYDRDTPDYDYDTLVAGLEEAGFKVDTTGARTNMVIWHFPEEDV